MNIKMDSNPKISTNILANEYIGPNIFEYLSVSKYLSRNDTLEKYI